MTEKRVTKKDNFAVLRAIVAGLTADTDDALELQIRMLAFIDHEVDLLNRKDNTAPNPKRTAENAAVRAEILGVLDGGEAMRAGEIAKLTPSNLSVQRVTAHLRELVKVGEVIREDGKVTTFRLP